ncbi:putative pyridoxal 5'-phosphate synthase subunit PDX2 [Golovinomyces cichoracearum]|uniref:glutaminase n=1 Tax=Golovinomyces cichoracearum TaxID=62708 RepID=A0A420IDF0_9PEZI|nr:putative pyridoxal 5'-phosphate synthase subunit PDX2 [Golovinomyces cichoracearum]
MEKVAAAQDVTVGVLALQGDFCEHMSLLRQAAKMLETEKNWTFKEIRTASELESCDALIIPGGESTAISLIAQETNLLEPLRRFVKVSKKPTWGTCAGLILLAETANKTKQNGQELIGGLDVKVNRNHFGRQLESFEAELDLSFLGPSRDSACPSTAEPQSSAPFKAIFIRAPVVQSIFNSESAKPTASDDPTTINAQSTGSLSPQRGPVKILARLPASTAKASALDTETGDIVAVKQDNVFGTSFHPELTRDARIHTWWLEQVLLTMAQLRA